MERLRAVDEYILLMKSGARQATRASFRAPFRPRVWRPPVWALTAGVAVLVAGIALKVPGASASHSAPVELVAFRGDDEMARAKAGRKLDLTIDLADLSASSNLYRVQIVDAMGNEQWSGKGVAPDAKLIAQISRPLKPGIYWVRISSAQGELLREFGLRAE